MSFISENWILRLCLIFTAISGFSISGVAQTGPGGVGNNQGTSRLQLWLRGDNTTLNGGNVSIWSDLSGHNHHLEQTMEGDQPTFHASYGGLNNMPSLEFDGAEDHLHDLDGEDYINGINGFTVFLIIEADADAIGTDVGIFDSEEPDDRDDQFTFRFDEDGGGGDVNLYKGSTGAGGTEAFETSSVRDLHVH